MCDAQMLWDKTGEKPAELQIKERKWKRTEHTISKDENAVERIVLDWNPQGTRNRGRPRKTCRRSVMEEAQRGGRTWREFGCEQRSLQELVEALCSYTGVNRR
jgi:hypothetical protein